MEMANDIEAKTTNLGNQIPSRCANMARKFEIDFSNSLVSIRMALSFEWWVADKKLVGQYTETHISTFAS